MADGLLFVNPPDQGLLVPGFAKALHDAQVVANGLLLDDKVSYRLAWNLCEGLFEPITLEPGQTFETLGGINHLEPWVDAYPARRIVLAGRIIGQPDYLTKFRQVAAIARAFVHRPVRLQIGQLVQNFDITAFRGPKDAYRGLPDKVTWEAEGSATPGLWLMTYGFATGTDQGIPCADDRPDHPGYLATVPAGAGNAVLVFTNQGDAPTGAALVLSVSDAAYKGRTVYVRNQDPRYPAQIPVNLDSFGVGELSPEAGLLLGPGLNWLRVEDAWGNLLNGPMVASIHGTVWRYHGASVDRRFSEGPILLTCFRTGKATYTRWDNAIVEAADHEPRAGVAFGDYFIEKAGAIFEPDGENLLQNSYFDGLANWQVLWPMVSPVATADPLAFHGTAARITPPPGLVAEYGVIFMQSAVAVPGQPYTASCLATGAFTGATIRAVLSFVDANLNTVGNPIKATIAGDREDQVIELRGYAPNGATRAYFGFEVDTTVAAAGYADVMNAQLEPFPFMTSYMPSGPYRTGRRKADHAAVWAPSQYHPYPRDFGKWTVVSGPAPVRDAENASADGTIRAWRWNIQAGSKICCKLSPDRPTTPWAAAIKLQALDAGLKLRMSLIDEQAGQTFATELIEPDPARGYETFFTAGQPSAGCITLLAVIEQVEGAGSIVLDTFRVVQGRFPGAQLPGSLGGIVRPKNVWEWLDSATQNLRLKFTVSLPPPSTGVDYSIFGDFQTGDFCLYRPATEPIESTKLRLVRRTNGDQKALDIDVGAIFDRQPHTIEIECLNVQDRKTKARAMYLRLYVDGEKRLPNGQAADPNFVSHLIWEWKRPERLCAADGKACVVLSKLAFVRPDLPFGTIPVG